MTTPDHRAERQDDAIRAVRALRAASGPPLDAAAARRIADGAWARTRPARTPRRGVGRIPHSARRVGIAAALLVAALGGAFVLRPSGPAFAVEGGPVQEWQGDAWQDTRRVRPGSTVFVATGVHALRGRGALAGEAILPEPGTTLRIVAADDAGRFAVELLGGATEVRGDALRLRVAGVDVAPRRDGAAYRAWGSLRAEPEAPALSPPRPLPTGAALARMGIHEGHATLVRTSTGESLDLAVDEMAALLPVHREGRVVFRLSRVLRFAPDLGVHIAGGHPVLDVHARRGGAIAVLAGPDSGVTGVDIAAAELPAALDQIHAAMLAFVAEVRLPPSGATPAPSFRAGDAGGTLLPLEALAFARGETLTEVETTRDGERVRVRVHGDGRIEIARGGAAREYPSVAAARAADPAAVDLVAAHLER